MRSAFRLGLTGGIGSGKSTVATVLATLGATVVDADAIARTLTASGGQAIDAIRQQFGVEYISPTGALDRERMRDLAFTDANAKQRLEAIVHPLVGCETRRLAQAADASGCPCLVFDIPLLVESGHWRDQVDQVLIVDCSVSTQIARVMARSRLSQSAVESIIAAQASRERRLRSGDAVIFNDGIDLNGLASELRSLAPCFGLSLAFPPEPSSEA